MTETQEGAPPAADKDGPAAQRPAKSPVRRVTLVVIVIGAIYFAYGYRHAAPTKWKVS